MRAFRTSLAVVGLLGMVPGLAAGQVDVGQMLRLKPVVKGARVEYDTPADEAAIAACKYEESTKPPGHILRDGTGKMLRRFLDSDAKPKLDQWSYYQDGFEVYRETDLDGKDNEDGKRTVDEARWMNGGGTRIAVVRANAIAGWKRISAEEASKVMVQAIAARDLDLLGTVMAKPDELAALGVPDAEVARCKAAEASRGQALDALKKGLVGWDPQTVWLQFNASMPHVIPADSAPGLKDDLTLYENAVILAAPANGSANDRMAFLQAGELIRVGETWKFVELPRAINPASSAPVVAMQGGVRSSIFGDPGNAGPSADPELTKAINALAAFDNANDSKLNGLDKREVARAYIGRTPYLKVVVKACKKPEDALSYEKQVVDSVASAYQTGQYPAGLNVLNVAEAAGGKLGSYAASRRLNAEYNLENDSPNANAVAVQKKWMNDMKDFLAKHGKSEEAPDILFQLASNNEFNAEEKEAREYYTQLVQSFPETPAGKKAAGALKRLDLVGQPIALKGKGLDGQTIDASQYRGKTLLIAFWATWAQPVKRDMPELTRIYEKNKAKGFEILGVCVDNEAKSLEDFLKDSPLKWSQVYEPGGMDGRLATEFGVILLPTMILVDAEGKVINRNIRSAADLDVQLEKVFAGKPSGGVALGVK